MNDEGIEEKDSWLDLKKYLQDFSNMRDKSMEMVVLWNYYLTYSMVLDLQSISKEEIVEFFGWNIYNTKKQKDEIIRKDNEYKIIEKIQYSENKEMIEKEINSELSKYYNINI